jgi:multidrug resistance efflux pump
MASLYAQGAISRQQNDETQANLAAAQAGLTQTQAGPTTTPEEPAKKASWLETSP